MHISNRAAITVIPTKFSTERLPMSTRLFVRGADLIRRLRQAQGDNLGVRLKPDLETTIRASYGMELHRPTLPCPCERVP